ncbi:hypothetical protein SDC9_143006 [bioreactor metagenome]|uniref:Uncharacterized protein n=1 Tax=bioreactor metagenome TaxID=1076179 RepID=A0A645E2S1_9ZZZZ
MCHNYRFGRVFGWRRIGLAHGERNFQLEFFKRVQSVPMLAALRAVGNLDSGWKVRYTHRAGGFVTLLAAVAGGLEEIQPALRRQGVVNGQ